MVLSKHNLGFHLLCVRARSLQSCLTLCDPMDYSLQAPLSMGFSRQEYWSGLPCPSPGDLSDPGIEPTSLKSLALVGRFFTTSTTWEALSSPTFVQNGISEGALPFPISVVLNGLKATVSKS